MHMQQLREQAYSFGKLLQSRGLTLKHGQILDLLAALPGLRNWPEVNAFQARVSSTPLDARAAMRLAKRILSVGGPSIEPQELLAILLPMAVERPQIWADGPQAGIYVSTEVGAVQNAIERYLDASDESLFYTEGVGEDSEGAINIGDEGLYSPGMARLSTGTLIVVGLLEISQNEWENCKSKLVAASNAANAGARVIVLCRTPQPDNLHADLADMLRLDEGPGYVDPTLIGEVSAAGEMMPLTPFVAARVKAKDLAQEFEAVVPPLPFHVAEPFFTALERRPYGLVIASSDAHSSRTRDWTCASMLPVLTQKLGPAARLMSSWTPGYGPVRDQDDRLLEQLPVLPSVESALQAGFKIIVVEGPSHAFLEALNSHWREACFVVAARAMWAGRALDHVCGTWTEADGGLDMLTAIVSHSDVATKGETLGDLWELYVHDHGRTIGAKAMRDLESFVQAHRQVRWEDQVLRLLEAEAISRPAVKKLFPYLELPARISKAGGSRVPKVPVESLQGN